MHRGLIRFWARAMTLIAMWEKPCLWAQMKRHIRPSRRQPSPGLLLSLHLRIGGAPRLSNSFMEKTYSQNGTWY